ncbi:MAG: hypothetical protein RL219_2255 [Actinomycetota bacterium]|jgi:hypothetical protein
MRLVGLLTDSCEVTTTDPTWFERAIRYDRRNARYRPAHELSLLVLRSAAFDDIYDTSSGRVGAFLLDMNVVFEKFITRLVEDALKPTDLTVDRQSRLQAVIRDDTTGRSYAATRCRAEVARDEVAEPTPTCDDGGGTHRCACQRRDGDEVDRPHRDHHEACGDGAQPRHGDGKGDDRSTDHGTGDATHRTFRVLPRHHEGGNTDDGDRDHDHTHHQRERLLETTVVLP